MKSSLATPKFDRLFPKQEQLNNNTADQNRPNSKNKGGDQKVIKEVRWKLDDLELGSRSRQLEDGRRRLWVALRALQTSLLEQHNLSLEEGMLKELQEHYLDLLQSGSVGGGGCDRKTWRECIPKKELLGEGFKKKGEKFEEALASVIASLELLGIPVNSANSSSLSIIGGGGDEEKKIAGGSSGPLKNSTREKSFSEVLSAKSIGNGSSWQFWFWRSDQRFLKWDNGLQKLGTPFQTVEQMRALLGQLLEVHEVVLPSDYSVFRNGVKPKWEDVANLEGGEWSVEFARADVDLVGAIWRRLLEFIFEGDGGASADISTTTNTSLNSTTRSHICGLKISMRFKAYLLSVWTGCFVDLEKTFQVGIAVQRTIAELVARVSPNYDQQQLVLHYRVHKRALAIEQKKRSLYYNGGSGNRFSNYQIF